MADDKKTMVQQLGDGSKICDKCWAREYPDKPEPENNWLLDTCDYCQKD